MAKIQLWFFGGTQGRCRGRESVAIEPGFYFVAGGENSFGLGSECRNILESSDRIFLEGVFKLIGILIYHRVVLLMVCHTSTYICTSRAHVPPHTLIHDHKCVHTHSDTHTTHIPHTYNTHTHSGSVLSLFGTEYTTHTHTLHGDIHTTIHTDYRHDHIRFSTLCDANTLCNTNDILTISINLVSLRLSVTYDMFGICFTPTTLRTHTLRHTHTTLYLKHMFGHTMTYLDLHWFYVCTL